MSDQKKRASWSLIAFSGALLLVGVLLGQGLLTPRAAQAQIPDSGAQLNAMITEMKTTNQKLTEVVGLLKEIRDAQVAEQGEKKDKAGKPPRP
jgi:lipid-A-disaccharide synthase-like uncharacterized protein